jgi:CheY-like chemotaxis protein
MNAGKILVVDDNTVVLKALEMKIAAAGYQVVTATDGAGALAAIRRERPDLVVLDITFPPDVGHGGVAWDGLLLMQWLGRIEESKDIPVVIITGQDPKKYRDQAMKLGAKAFFYKPVDHAALIKVICDTLASNPRLPTS